MKPQRALSDVPTDVPQIPKPRRAAVVLRFPPIATDRPKDDTRHIRLVMALLRRPELVFVTLVARLWKLGPPYSAEAVRKLVAGNDQALDLFLAARESSAAFVHFIVSEYCRGLKKEPPKGEGDAGVTVEMTRFVSLLRRRGVKISKASIYRYAQLFDQTGLLALAPKYGQGGRPRRSIPPAHKALIDDLFSKPPSHRVYVAAARELGVPGPPVSEGIYRRMRAERGRNQEGATPRTTK